MNIRASDRVARSVKNTNLTGSMAICVSIPATERARIVPPLWT